MVVKRNTTVKVYSYLENECMHVLMCVCFHTWNCSGIHQQVPDYYPKPKGMPSLSQEGEKKRTSRLSFASQLPVRKNKKNMKKKKNARKEKK